jgi:hypothetical protein
VGGENHVRGSGKDLSHRMSLDVVSEAEAKAMDHPLMPHEGRVAHVVLSVDDLMALPVLRNEEVVLVGQLLGGKVVECHGVRLLSRTTVTRDRRGFC